MPSKDLWGHHLLLEKGTRRLEEKTKRETAGHFCAVRGQGMRPKSNPEFPSIQAPLAWIQDTQEWEKLRWLGRGKSLPGHMPVGAARMSVRSKARRSGSDACLLTVCLWPWTQPSCSEELRSELWG